MRKVFSNTAAALAETLKGGMTVMSGGFGLCGIPTLVANYILDSMQVTLESENGMLGMMPFPFEGEEHADVINAGKQTITELKKTSYFSSADSSAMLRRSHIDLSILRTWGAIQSQLPAKRWKMLAGRSATPLVHPALAFSTRCCSR